MGTILKNGINYSGSGSGGGVSSYNELTNKPSINNVTLTGNKTTADLGITSPTKTSDLTNDSGFYSSNDTAETTLADGDSFPFYDTSASGRRKSLWSNIKSALKSYFDSFYQKTLTAGSNITISSNTISASLPTLGTINRSDLYETTEKVVGKWTDGRPLYQKVITLTTPQCSTDGTFVDTYTSIGATTNEIVLCHVVGSSSGVTVYVPNYGKTQSLLSSNKMLGVLYATFTNASSSNKNTIRLSNSSTTFNSYTFKAIAQYTKTSDSANSYNYASENDYSTSEKIIGTWIDGSTLYQKTINFGTLPNNTTKTVAHSISGTFTVVDMKAIAINGTTQTFASEFYDGSSYCFINRLGTNIQAKTNANFTSYSVYVTIKYVKKQL